MPFSISPDLYSPIAIITSAFFASFFAHRSINSAREMSRKKHTLDFLRDSNTNPDLHKAQGVFRALVKTKTTPEDIAEYAEIENSPDDEITALIADLLNHYEEMAVAVDLGIYDNDMLKKSRFRITTRVYEVLKPFIGNRRKIKKHYTLWIQFERLVSKWETDPLLVEHVLKPYYSTWLFVSIMVVCAAFSAGITRIIVLW
jgi:uncharacterized protein DUF4760